MTGHNWSVDPLAGSPEDAINSTDHDCQPFAIPGLPVLPIVFALFASERLRPAPQLATLSLLTFLSVPVFPKEKQLNTHLHSPSSRGQRGKQDKRLIFHTPRSEKLYGKANIILLLNMEI